MNNEPIGNTLRTALTRLPPADATLAQLVRFCHENSPIDEFKERWGAEYSQRARELWGSSTQAFKKDHPIGASPDELLLCMAFDTAVAPYLGAPEEISHKYLHAVLRELSESVKSPSWAPHAGFGSFCSRPAALDSCNGLRNERQRSRMNAIGKYKWPVVRLAIALFSFCRYLMETDAPELLPLGIVGAAWLMVFIALVMSALLLFLFGIQAANPRSAPQWPYPRHSENPFDLQYPLRFFHFGATCVAAGALGSAVSSIWRGTEALPLITLTTGVALGLWLGVNAAWRLLRRKKAEGTTGQQL